MEHMISVQNYAVELKVDYLHPEQGKKELEALVELEGVKEYNRIKRTYMDTYLPIEKAAAFLQQDRWYDTDLGYRYTVNLNGIADEKFDDFLKTQGIILEEHGENTLTAVLINSARFKDRESGRYVEPSVTNLEVGDRKIGRASCRERVSSPV